MNGTDAQKSTLRSREIFIRIVVALLFIIGGWFLVQDSVGKPATRWLRMYEFRDFETLGDVGSYLRHLRTGIPPVISVAEILTYMLTGSEKLITLFAYRYGMLLMFLIPPFLLTRTRGEFWFACVASFVFLWSTPIIVAPNAIDYDVFFPLFVLLYVLTLKFIWARATPSTGLMVVCLISGLLLSVAELSRPFMIFLLPFFLIGAYGALHRFPKRYFMVFLIPLLLLTGGWHLKLYALHNGQFVWSNIAGSNMYNAWKELLDEQPEIIQKGDPRYDELNVVGFKGSGAGIWGLPSLNTELRYHYAKVRSAAVRRFILRHPVKAAINGHEGLGRLLQPPVKAFPNMYEPTDTILSFYRPFVWVTSLALLINGILLAYFVFRDRSLKLFASPYAAMLVYGCGGVFFYSIGESGEQGRFLTTLLPFMAALPRVATMRYVDGKRQFVALYPCYTNAEKTE